MSGVNLLLRIEWPRPAAHVALRVFGGPDADHRALLGTLYARPDEALAVATVFAAVQAYGLDHGTVTVEGMDLLAASERSARRCEEAAP